MLKTNHLDQRLTFTRIQITTLCDIVHIEHVELSLSQLVDVALNSRANKFTLDSKVATDFTHLSFNVFTNRSSPEAVVLITLQVKVTAANAELAINQVASHAATFKLFSDFELDASFIRCNNLFHQVLSTFLISLRNSSREVTTNLTCKLSRHSHLPLLDVQQLADVNTFVVFKLSVRTSAKLDRHRSSERK